MRKIALFVMLVVTIACTKPQIGENRVEVPLQSDYILFDADVQTKASPLVTSMRGKTFGVVGFPYTSDWVTYRGAEEAAPDSLVLSVSCKAEDGLCTYSPTRRWGNKKKYAFFAWYPNTSVTTLSDKIGTPAITYTVPSSTDPTQYPDLMTAMVTDATNTGDGTVSFNFKHRLCGLTIDARNLNDVTETIKNLTITFSSVYSKAIFPLDPSFEITPTATKEDVSYTIQGTNESVSVPVASGNSSTTNISGDKIILLIPRQMSQGDLEGTISFKRGNASKAKSYDFAVGKDLVAGKIYTLTISFSENAVSVTVNESKEWTDMDQYIVFE